MFQKRVDNDKISIICPCGPATFYYGRPITQTSPRCSWTFKATRNSAWCIGLVPKAFWEKGDYLMVEDLTKEVVDTSENDWIRVIGLKSTPTSGGVLSRANMHQKDVTVIIDKVNGKKTIAFNFEGSVYQSTVPGRDSRTVFEIPEDYGYPIKLGFSGFNTTQIEWTVSCDHVIYFLFVSLNNKEPFGGIPRELHFVIAVVLWEL